MIADEIASGMGRASGERAKNKIQAPQMSGEVEADAFPQQYNLISTTQKNTKKSSFFIYM